ncbi:hypothetical protein [Calothrix sp. NIES-2098]|uniref:hypothetical protein n=1 Tax=Calothrix sp. NIES-2098 TaxID=1954171 RepID=UPI000B61BC3D|nr:WD-40 repeat protein [Calothrix sp. NIES-2098]
MMTQAWPFLISRNQSVDYNTVVAPDFITQAKIRSLLLKVSDDELAEDGEVSIRWVHGSPVGDFTVVFRVSQAKKRDIGKSENDILRDPFGREIYLIEGLVFLETPDELHGKIKQIHLDLAHRELKEKYKEFWNENKISDSNNIDVREDVSSPVIKLKKLEPFSITSRRQLPVAVQHRTRTSNSAIKNRVSLSTILVTTLTVLFLLGIFWKIFGGDQIISGQRLEEIKNCSYITQNVQITFDNNQRDGSRPLQDLKKKHPEAWIFLEGSLNVKLPDEIKKLVIENKKRQKSGNDKQTITLVDEKLEMSYHPLNAAIALLQNQSVTSDNLKARIIELGQPESISQCPSKKALVHRG